MVRPFSVWMLLGLALAVLATGAGWRRAAVAVAWPVGVLVLVFVPWTIRNAVEMDGFVVSSTNMGDTLCLDRNLDATGRFRWADHDGCVDPRPARGRAQQREHEEGDRLRDRPSRPRAAADRPPRALHVRARPRRHHRDRDVSVTEPIFTDGQRDLLETRRRRLVLRGARRRRARAATAGPRQPPTRTPARAGHICSTAGHPLVAVGQPAVPPAPHPLLRVERGGAVSWRPVVLLPRLWTTRSDPQGSPAGSAQA